MSALAPLPTGVAPEVPIMPLIGARIGNGKSRVVYKVVGHPQLVIKEGTIPPYAGNRTEWETWNLVVGTKLEPRFARCLAVSNTWRLLIMERLADLSAADLALVPPMPIWLTDRKPGAVGKTPAGVIKVRDYGNLNPHPDPINAPEMPWTPRADVADMADILKKLS